MLGKVDTLKKVKEAEEKVRSQREAAREQAAAILRDARAKAQSDLAKARADAETAYAGRVDDERKAIQAEREKILKRGAAAGEDIRKRAEGREIGAAVDILLEKFRQRAMGKA